MARAKGLAYRQEEKFSKVSLLLDLLCRMTKKLTFENLRKNTGKKKTGRNSGKFRSLLNLLRKWIYS